MKELQIEDPNLIKKRPNTEHQIFTKFIKDKNGYLIGDKAFIFTLTDGKGFNVITPKVPSKQDDIKNKRLNTKNANFTRSVTSIRNVIESVMTDFKHKFEKLSDILDLKLVPNLEQELYNFAYLLNKYMTIKKINLKKNKQTIRQNMIS